MSDNLLETYNPLYDVHLRQYFALPHMQKHLRNLGLLESKLDIHAAAQDPHSGHHQMMDQLLRNRERVLQQMAEIQKKLDAAEKVELYRRIRSGVTNIDELDRSHMSRSLSRPARSAKSRTGNMGKRERRHSGNFDANELIKRVEENYRSESGPFRNQRNIYNRLAANVYKYQYLHKLDDRTLQNYINSLRKSLQKLERFREVTFGPHTMARHQPSQLQQSWFFRRRSLPSLNSNSSATHPPSNQSTTFTTNPILHRRRSRQASSSRRAGKSQSPSKVNNAANDGGPPSKMIRNSGSRTRNARKLPPLQPKSLPKITPTLNTDASKARLPPANSSSNRLSRKVEATPQVAKDSAGKKSIPRKVKKEGTLESTVLPIIGGAVAAGATTTAIASAADFIQPDIDGGQADVEKFQDQGPEVSAAPSPSISLAASQTTDQDLGSKAGSEWEEQGQQKGESSMSGDIEESAGHTETRPTPEPFLEAKSVEPEQLVLDNDHAIDGEETLRERRSVGLEEPAAEIEDERMDEGTTPEQEHIQEAPDIVSPTQQESELNVASANELALDQTIEQQVPQMEVEETPVEETTFVDESLERENEHQEIEGSSQIAESRQSFDAPIHGEFEAHDEQHKPLEDESHMGEEESILRDQVQMTEASPDIHEEAVGDTSELPESTHESEHDVEGTIDGEMTHIEDSESRDITKFQDHEQVPESPKEWESSTEHVSAQEHDIQGAETSPTLEHLERPDSTDESPQEHFEVCETPKNSQTSAHESPREEKSISSPSLTIEVPQTDMEHFDALERPDSMGAQSQEQTHETPRDQDSIPDSINPQEDEIPLESAVEQEIPQDTHVEESENPASEESYQIDHEDHQEVPSPVPDSYRSDALRETSKNEDENEKESAGSPQEVHQGNFEIDNKSETSARSVENMAGAGLQNDHEETNLEEKVNIQRDVVSPTSDNEENKELHESAPTTAFDYYREGSQSRGEPNGNAEERVDAPVRIEVIPSPDHTDEDGYLIEPAVEQTQDIGYDVDINGNKSEEGDLSHRTNAEESHIIEGDFNGNIEEDGSIKNEIPASISEADQLIESPIQSEQHNEDQGADEYLVESQSFEPTETEPLKSPWSKTPPESLPERESPSILHEPGQVEDILCEDAVNRQIEPEDGDQLLVESESPDHYKERDEGEHEDFEIVSKSEKLNSSSNTSLCDKESVKSGDGEVEEGNGSLSKRSVEEQELVENEPVDLNNEEIERKLSSASSYRNESHRSDSADEKNVNLQSESQTFPENEMGKESPGAGEFVESYYKYENGPNSPPPSPKKNDAEESEYEPKDTEIQQDLEERFVGNGTPDQHANNQHEEALDDGDQRPASGDSAQIEDREKKTANQLIAQPSIEITPASEYDPNSVDDNLSRLSASAEPENQHSDQFTSAEEYYRMGSAHGMVTENTPDGNGTNLPSPKESFDEPHQIPENQNETKVDSPIPDHDQDNNAEKASLGNGFHGENHSEHLEGFRQNGHKSDSEHEAKDESEDGGSLHDERSSLLGKTNQHPGGLEHEFAGHGNQI